MLDQTTNGDTALGTEVTRRVMQLRLVAGLLQGLLLYGLYYSSKNNLWLAGQPYLMVPLVFAGSLLPVVVVSAMGHMAPRTVLSWALLALALMWMLATHDVWRNMGGTPSEYGLPRTWLPSGYLCVFGAGFFYIAHALTLAGAQEGRLVARYTTYFETAWKLLIQLKFSGLFALALWLMLWLGSSLFMLVNLAFLKHLMEESWFVVPVLSTAFAWAMHITDVRPAIVRGIRTLLLVLMSWILPLAALLMTGFLCSLPFTGLHALWATRHATAVLLSADAVLLVLINAAWQNGEAGDGVAAIIRASARAASVLLLPLTVIAVYSLGLRVSEYGWSTDRVIAAACLVVASCYAAGYIWAAYGQGGWLDLIAPVNVVAAFLVLAVLLALFTPVADPARVAVSDQMARLAKGRVSADKFDFNYLRFEGVRYGQDALEQLSRTTSGADAALLRERATSVRKETNRWDRTARQVTPATIGANVQVWPAGAQLPASFLRQQWGSADFPGLLPRCLTDGASRCDAFMLDMNGDGKQEVLVYSSAPGLPGVLLTEQAEGKWLVIGTMSYALSQCEPLLNKLKAGQYTLVPAQLRDIEIAGLRIPLERRIDNQVRCDALK